ncbi:hypothetical protein SDRG_09826 [Saprolegnia diclina VS20]|uniref:Chromatin associated protein KTI12 n=1 Tax=Saprolegnia diclina (strain VS20) TaxID=1156394 RepID=T0QFZ7_SAPDV|nr:hypothetical protein SDRG_09826 [Saprolegnia diclina VS20]EQC32500.1 hypothetical protein SDRG_09826 [Saprolegnia diclina VS20]|eukprot:XP_008614001.1 hypothetical protein SDRG_09826 [Saprolegnia diclina VS20]
MPLVTLCGLPGAGKTWFASQLHDHFVSLGKDVVRLSYDSEHLIRADAYRDARAEKTTRSTMKSRVDVHLSADKIVILDTLNYIKGCRYELFCLAKELSTTHCVVYVDTPVALASARNAERAGDSFPPESIEAIAMRFEVPNAKNRWDAPLLRMTPESLCATTVADRLRDVEDAVLHGKVIKAGIATIAKPIVETTFVQELDRVTAAIVDVLIVHQREFQDLVDALRVPHASKPVQVGRAMPTAELRRHRRQFTKMATLHPFPSADIGNRFVEYLQSQA